MSSDPQLIALRRQVVHYHAGGVVDIAPASVVAGQLVTAYDVLPEEAGLLQLAIQGALVHDAQGAFVVRRPMRFPGGLGGAHSVRFIVPKGVPRPTGNPGQSRVVEGDAPGGKP